MAANNHAAPQLMTLGVLKQYIRLSHKHKAPTVAKLAELRHMTPNGVRLHLVYLLRQGYIERRGSSWKTVVITGKGLNA